MFGLFITGAVLNFVMIFLSPLAVSSRPPQAIKYLVGYSSSSAPVGRPPHRRRTFIWLRALPFLFLSFITALVTVVASAVATVMFIIFANVFTQADPSLNIKAHVGKQMFAFMWVAAAFSLFAFILQIGSCCAACCGGHKARKQLKQQGVELYEKRSSHSTSSPTTPTAQQQQQHEQPHAVTTD